MKHPGEGITKLAKIASEIHRISLSTHSKAIFILEQAKATDFLAYSSIIRFNSSWGALT